MTHTADFYLLAYHERCSTSGQMSGASTKVIVGLHDISKTEQVQAEVDSFFSVPQADDMSCLEIKRLFISGDVSIQLLDQS